MKKGRREYWVELGGVCRDCGLREDRYRRSILDAVGRPRRHKWYGFRMSRQCIGCGGSGTTSVKVENLQRLLDSLTRRKKRPLTPKQKFVLELRYGLKDDNSYTLREIAGFMGISHKNVRKHEEGARAKVDSIVRELERKDLYI